MKVKYYRPWGNHQFMDEKVNRVHDKSQSSMGVLREESQVNIGAIREELSDMRKQKRNRTEDVHGANRPLFGGVKAESHERTPSAQKAPCAQMPCAQQMPSAQNR